MIGIEACLSGLQYFGVLMSSNLEWDRDWSDGYVEVPMCLYASANGSWEAVQYLGM